MLNYLLFLAVIFLLIRLVFILKSKNTSESDNSDDADAVLDDAKRILNSEED